MTERTAEVPVRQPRRGRPPNLTEDEAREITARIKLTSREVCLMVAEAHARRADKALGYETWRDYVEKELHMSESRSYQLIDAGKVVRVVHEVFGSGSSTLEAVPTQREAAKAVSQLPKLRSGLREAKKAGIDSPSDAMHGAIRALPIPATRGGRNDGLEASMARHPSGKKRLNMPEGAVVCETCGGRGWTLPES